MENPSREILRYQGSTIFPLLMWRQYRNRLSQEAQREILFLLITARYHVTYAQDIKDFHAAGVVLSQENFVKAILITMKQGRVGPIEAFFALGIDPLAPLPHDQVKEIICNLIRHPHNGALLNLLLQKKFPIPQETIEGALNEVFTTSSHSNVLDIVRTLLKHFTFSTEYLTSLLDRAKTYANRQLGDLKSDLADTLQQYGMGQLCTNSFLTSASLVKDSWINIVVILKGELEIKSLLALSPDLFRDS